MGDSADFEADSYSTRTAAFEGSVLLRNSRSDYVHRLLRRSQPIGSVLESGVAFGTTSQSLPRLAGWSHKDKSASSPSSSAQSQLCRSRSASFATVRGGESALEKVDPSSFELVN